MKKFLLIATIFLLTSFNHNKENSNPENTSSSSEEVQKTKVLNFATFHMGSTSDANSVDFDEKDEKNQADAQKIARMISKFKPTIICVEMTSEEQAELDTAYQNYLSHPGEKSSYHGEVGLVAFEVGRMSNIDKIHGIDHEMKYNYNIAAEITNSIDSITIQNFYANPFKFFPELNVNEDELSLLERLQIGNSPAFLDFLILINADLLTHVGTENGYEGADEAAKYYHRNLRIYSNLNRIHATSEDRIFILSGGSHAAFLGEFLKRSTKYEVVNTMDYLK